MIFIDCWQFKIAVKILTCLDDVRPVYNSIVKKAINIFEFEFHFICFCNIFLQIP